MPLLSICIPTYNRAQFLDVSLRELISQASEISDSIEIVISDNASTDSTKQVVEDAQKKYPAIVYSCNSENLGYDRNLDAAIRKSSGEFCWFLSDDEILLSGWLSVLIDLLITHPDIAYLCFDVRGNSIRKFPTERITLLEDWEELLREYGVVGWLISQNIIARKWYPKNTEIYHGNMWIHLSIIFDIISHRPLLLLDQSITKGQRNVCTWAKWGKGLFTYTSLKNIITSWKNIGYTSATIDRVLSEFLVSFPKILISAKIQWLPLSRENFSFIQKEYRLYWFQRFLWTCIFFLPVSPYIYLRKLLWK